MKGNPRINKVWLHYVITSFRYRRLRVAPEPQVAEDLGEDMIV